MANMDESQTKEDTERYPAYLNKFKYLTKDNSLAILDGILPSVANFFRRLAKKGQRVNREDLSQVVAFATHTDLGSALPTKKITDFHTWVNQRWSEHGCRLQAFNVDGTKGTLEEQCICRISKQHSQSTWTTKM